MHVDLRSDTVTLPTVAMKEAMMSAPLGDDVLGDDPTVHALQHKAAALFGMEAALFFPTGTMSNQVAVKVHTQPGDEVIIEGTSHTYSLESGGIGFHSGCSVRQIQGDRGRIGAEQIVRNINPQNDHYAPTRLVVIENTCNRGGGSCYSLEDMELLSTTARAHGLRIHLDGARIFNAVVRLGFRPAQLGPLFDSISFCLSKGLGCPAGSVLVGSQAVINKARKYRKLFGGAMRQSGMLAAAGLYALANHVERLADDHRRAQRLGDALHHMWFVRSVMPVETNIIIFQLVPDMPAQQFVERLRAQNIRCVAIGPDQVRMVTHLDISDEMIGYTVQVLERLDKV